MFEIIKEGVKSLKNIKEEKCEYKNYLNRIKALPADYRFVFEKMTSYMWSFSAGGDGYDMIKIQTDLLKLFESSTVDGKTVFEVTGKDVAVFCDELLQNTRTYTGNCHEKLNRDIEKRLLNK